MQEVVEETAQQLHAFVPKSGNTDCTQQCIPVQRLQAIPPSWLCAFHLTYVM